jgi:hypothetical protein
MDVDYVFAGLVVANRDRAAVWYERLFGRPADFFPNDAEAVWRLADTASVYLLADKDRAGQGVMTLIVTDLDSRLGISGRGIAAGPIEDIEGVGRKSVTKDPDSKAVAFAELR